jgi:prepilin-type N-terminal cleavage/methylation domain-containing protein
MEEKLLYRPLCHQSQTGMSLLETLIALALLLIVSAGSHWNRHDWNDADDEDDGHDCKSHGNAQQRAQRDGITSTRNRPSRENLLT